MYNRKLNCVVVLGALGLGALCLGALGLSAVLSPSVASATPTRRPPTEPAPQCPSIDRGSYPVRVQWSAPTASSGCFFFSGPGDLGRDDQLGSRAQLSWQGTEMTLAFGGARFAGAVTGDRVALERRSTHDYSSPWLVTERIEGRIESVQRSGATCRVLRARYAYQEQPAGESPGRCTIAAALGVSR